jgi:phosphonate transport system permease protein
MNSDRRRRPAAPRLLSPAGPSAGRTPTEFFRRRKALFTLIFLGLLALAVGAAVYTKFKPETAFTAVPRVAAWVGQNLLPVVWDSGGVRLDAQAVGRLPHILQKLAETILMSIMASLAGSLCSFVVALFGSRTTQVAKPLALLARAVASLNRNIPVAAWALIFLMSFGQSAFTGFLALFFYSFGFMSRVFIETIDEASGSAVEALRATGASYSQVIAQAVVPSTLPQIVSWMLYMIETNIRSAALVGILTGSGVGFLFSVYYASRQYRSAALVVLAIVAVVIAIELVSNALRRVFL